MPSKASSLKHQRFIVRRQDLDAVVGPNRRLQRGVAQQFYEMAPERIAALKLALKGPDFPALAEWCHMLRGSAAIMGAAAIARAIERLTAALDARDALQARLEGQLLVQEIRLFSVDLAKAFALQP